MGDCVTELDCESVGENVGVKLSVWDWVSDLLLLASWEYDTVVEAE